MKGAKPGGGAAPGIDISFDPAKIAAEHITCLVVGPYLAADKRDAAAALRARSNEARLDEAGGLARAIDLNVVGAEFVGLKAIRPSTFIGKGRLEALVARVEAEEISLVVMDCALSPVQQRNLEKALSAKVIDRTGLILEIFGRRARTREGALQVELAHLTYQKSRLVRSWTHLERQRGGFGFLGGPGETQIETDRRLIQERMIRIERELEGVVKTRGLHRASRKDVPFPIVALVGYTNAGKSTLFNLLTKAKVLAEDMLFATLDPTLRALALPHGGKAILSDTVGFISDLPTMLVSAFRATLEEVIGADVILHVRDIAHEDTLSQSADVEAILRELGIDPHSGRLIEVWNKSDLLSGEARRAVLNSAALRDAEARPIIVSALTGEGTADLLGAVEARMARDRSTLDLTLEGADGQGLHWLYENAEILFRSDDDEGRVHLKVRVAPGQDERLRRRFGAAVG